MKTTGFFTAAVFALGTFFAFGNEALRVEITKTDITCFGQANGKAELYIAGGEAPYSVQWNNGQSATEIVDLKKGTYVVTVTDAEGNTVKDSVKINMPSPISVSYNVPRTTDVANFNSEMNIAVNGGTPWEVENTNAMYMFRLNDKSYYEHPEKLEDGIYKMTVEDARGCKLSMNVNLQVQLENEPAVQKETEFNGFGNVKMTVHPIHLVIEQQQKTFTQNYN